MLMAESRVLVGGGTGVVVAIAVGREAETSQSRVWERSMRILKKRDEDETRLVEYLVYHTQKKEF